MEEEGAHGPEGRRVPLQGKGKKELVFPLGGQKGNEERNLWANTASTGKRGGILWHSRWSEGGGPWRNAWTWL